MSTAESDVGQEMHDFLARLFPICRSITGDGVRQTLQHIGEIIPLTIHEVPSGTGVFDWTVPKEWNIRDAYILDERGRKVVDFKENNLHVVGYSVPVDRTVSLAELQNHLHSLEQQPDAIPYITSYYNEYWGFCIQHARRMELAEGDYRVVIDSDLRDGTLTYGELIVPGESGQEIFFSTYVCHPQMANNELSGPVLTTYLAKWIAAEPRRFTYRFVFVPETIGSLTYLSRNLDAMKRNTIAGFNVTCVGDEGSFSYLPSRREDTLADRAAVCVLRHAAPEFRRYSYLERGSDERQYCSPGIDLPVASIMRSKYGTYPEYHTSLDDLDFVTPAGLSGSFAVYQECVRLLEANRVYRATCLGEPQLGKRGLYPSLSTRSSGYEARDLLNVLAYADGTRDLIGISSVTDLAPWSVREIVQTLLAHDLLVAVDP